jgi:hypothetical protein
MVDAKYVPRQLCVARFVSHCFYHGAIACSDFLRVLASLAKPRKSTQAGEANQKDCFHER